MEDTGKVFLEAPLTCSWTTGNASIVVKGSKNRLDGKSLPNDDTSGKLAKPLVGVPVDLNAGTGTLVSTTALFNQKNKTLGIMDYLQGQTYVMKITKQ